MSFEAENVLLVAVRDAIRAATSLADDAVRVEIDEDAPATSGDTVVMVHPGGITPGPSHDTNSGAADLIYAVDVTIGKRSPRVARDRSRNLRAELNELMQTIFNAIDFEYDVMTEANSSLLSSYSDPYGFVEPLRFVSVTAKPRMAPAEMFAASTENRAALTRTIRFSGARKTTVR